MTLRTVTYDDSKFKIVPIEPTEEMEIAGMHLVCSEQSYKYMIAAAPEYKEPENPLDTPLPCDIKVGHGTIGKGCKLSTLVLRMNVLYDLAMKNNSVIAPDPRMNEPWTEEERKDLRKAVAEIFNWNQGTCTDGGKCGAGGYCESCIANQEPKESEE